MIIEERVVNFFGIVKKSASTERRVVASER